MTILESIKWLYTTTKGMRLRLSLTTLLGLLSVVSSLLFVWVSKRLVDIATKGSESGSLNHYIILFAVVIVAQQVISICRIKLNTINSTSLMNQLRIKLFSTVMHSEWSGKESFHTGDIVNRLDSDTRTISETVCVTLPTIVITLAQFFASFRFLQILDARLAWILVVIMPLSLIISKRYLLKMRELTQAIRQSDSEVMTHIQEQIQHRTTINTMGNCDSSIETLRNHSSKLFRQTLNSINYTLYSRTIVQFGFGAGYLLTFIWGVKGLSSGVISFGVMTAFLQLVSQVQRPIVDLSSQISASAKCTASVERLREIERLKQESEDESRVLAGEIGIEIKNLSFSYPDATERTILSDFNYNFKPNSMHVIVGQTGVGKSTLIRLMLGLLKTQEGSLTLYNNQGEREECSASTRSNFIYVPQGNTLMSGTIVDNLRLAKPDASNEEIREVLHCAVADFVYDLPNGVETICGERGAGLSEGEAQRIAIARGLLQRGGVMLLDEPTSALDAQTEELLIKRLGNYSKNRTLIMVTHRDTAAQLCASVVKLSKQRYE